MDDCGVGKKRKRNGRGIKSKDLESLPRCSPGFSWGISVVSPTFCLCYAWFCLGPFPISFSGSLSPYFSFAAVDLTSLRLWPRREICSGAYVRFSRGQKGGQRFVRASQKGSGIFFLRLEAKPICRFEKFPLKTVNRTLWIFFRRRWEWRGLSRWVFFSIFYAFWHLAEGQANKLAGSWQRTRSWLLLAARDPSSIW